MWQDTVNISGADFGPSTEPDNRLVVTFTHAVPKPNSLVFTATGCRVTVNHVSITCTTPAGVGSAQAWTVSMDGLSSYAPGKNATLPPGVAVASISTSYTTPLVRCSPRPSPSVRWVTSGCL